MKEINEKIKATSKLSLNDSEIRYRRLFEAAQDGIIILHAKTGIIEDINPYLLEILGYSRSELINKNLRKLEAFKALETSREAFAVLQKDETMRLGESNT